MALQEESRFLVLLVIEHAPRIMCIYIYIYLCLRLHGAWTASLVLSLCSESQKQKNEEPVQTPDMWQAKPQGHDPEIFATGRDAHR